MAVRECRRGTSVDRFNHALSGLRRDRLLVGHLDVHLRRQIQPRVKWIETSPLTMIRVRRYAATPLRRYAATPLSTDSTTR